MTKELPLISIVIPVYNREIFVAEAIDSALEQTYPNKEIVVIDNQSTDSTWEVLKSYQQRFPNKIRIFQNESNIGPVLNWKKGFELSKGEYIKLLFSDDLIAPSFLSSTYTLFDDETAFVLSGVKIIDDSTGKTLTQLIFQNTSANAYLHDILLYNQHEFPVSPGAALFRKKDLLNALTLEIKNTDGLVHIKNGAGIDLLLYLITAARYDKIKSCNEYLCTFRAHEGSITISSGPELFLYYAWAMYNFIREYKPSMLSRFKARTVLFKIRYKNNYENLYSSLEKIKISYLFFIQKSYFILKKRLFFFLS